MSTRDDLTMAVTHDGRSVTIDRIESARVESDLRTADAAFSITVAKPDYLITAGDPCRLFVNGQPILTGAIDRLTRGYSKQERTLTIEGRDNMGMAVDSCVTSFTPFTGYTVQRAAETLIPPLFPARATMIVYGEGVAAMDITDKSAQARPGETVFEFLRGMLAARGLMLYCDPTGRFVITRQNAPARAHVKTLVNVDGRNRSGILSAERTDDVTRRYARTVVVGQRNGDDGTSLDDEIEISACVADPSTASRRVLVVVADDAAIDPATHARALIARQKADGIQERYTVQGFTQGGIPWGVNVPCTVDDDVLDIHATRRVTGVTLRHEKDGGTTMEITLGVMG